MEPANGPRGVKFDFVVSLLGARCTLGRRRPEMRFLDLHSYEQLNSPMFGRVVTGKPLYVGDTGGIRLWREASLLQGLELGRVWLDLHGFGCSAGLLCQAASLDVRKVGFLLNNDKFY